MINLAFYCDQIIPENEAITETLLAAIAANGLGTRIGYVASGPEPDRRFFRERAAYYARHGLDLCLFHDLDERRTPYDEDALFHCDAIHLSGGHTGRFLFRLKRSGLFPRLKRWATDGGLLIGTSAGAIILTPTIATDALFINQAPEDHMNETSLGLVPFEFFPHLNSSSAYLPDLIRYSRHTPRPIIACNDGDGLIVMKGDIVCIGQPVWVKNGEARRAHSMPLSAIPASA
ncbi:Type 1 glutamine amidotransferase-like domain-containing protein [Agrobacterium vitis]|uniref:Type 1 glutamine amidotransferase-like domain-containing protein n=1 Tax=Agrobacterium vitis TaxID=373 RepID=UPI001571B30E|nr:Type 1 glutamine amidotransferase-like domain-containing protein [Agrobacterium vitis]NSZ16004.1 type 1 glutamine amidotransferase-like domain-containing protein [Agrobacterium vitis]QZO04789.1 Type 1 glutamine amidotransferase-like domain-containing protein [Agrobacterium vitis]UJL86934.1 Type 1 glutamine amidotransferase-like domain-containing protein [Agrobacterium vitis]